MRSHVLHCYFNNSRSLCNKLEDLNFLLECSKYEVLGFCETWLNSNLLDGLLLRNNNDYDLFRKDRGTRGGGVGWPCSVSP